MQFFAQLMASPDVSDEWKRRAYRELNPMGENFYIMRKEEIKTPIRLYGECALVFGNYRGLTEPYSVNKENSFDYAMAVCRPLQEAYAHSGHYRYLIARNHLKGWERIRCSFPKFAQTLDKTAFAVTGDAFDELVKADNPGVSRLTCDLNGYSLTADCIWRLAYARAKNILVHLVADRTEELSRVLPLDQVALYFSAFGDWQMAEAVGEALERVSPGIFRATRDIHGNDALWYTQYALESTTRPGHHDVETAEEKGARLQTRESYIRFLRGTGCDPQVRNHLGIAYADLH